MRYIVCIAVIILSLSATLYSQEVSREQRIDRIMALQKQIVEQVNDAMLPSPDDMKQARSEGIHVTRLMPREKFEGIFEVYGGSYYSFSKDSHGYGNVPELELQRSNLSVGFSGADFGFLADLGSISLASVGDRMPEVNFLTEYKPPSLLSEIRAEQTRSRKYETPVGIFYRSLPAIMGHAYVLRAITFGRADVLVAFKVVRMDSDTSLIINWKLLNTFNKPIIVEDKLENR